MSAGTRSLHLPRSYVCINRRTVLYESTAWVIAQREAFDMFKQAHSDQRYQLEFTDIQSSIVYFPGLSPQSCHVSFLYMFTSYGVVVGVLAAYVVEYEEFGKPFHAFISGVNGRVFGLQQTLFPAPQFAGMVQWINGLRWSDLTLSDAKNTARIVRLFRLFGRTLLRTPVIAFAALASVSSPFVHALSLHRTRVSGKVAWEAEKQAEVQAQSRASDSWTFQHGNGYAVFQHVPQSQSGFDAATLAAIDNIARARSKLEPLLHDCANANVKALDAQTVHLLASFYTAFGGRTPYSSSVTFRPGLRVLMARYGQESVDRARALRFVYESLSVRPRREVIDQAWFATNHIPLDGEQEPRLME